MTTYQLLIDGQFVDGVRTIPVINPATEEAFADCPVADAAMLDQAVAAARRAYPSWSARPVADRADHLLKLADEMMTDIDGFARLLTTEQGKPLDQAYFEMHGAIATLRTFAAMTLEPRTLSENDDAKTVEIRAPLGVVAAITPWNFPVILLMNKVGPALLAGNTMVAKPAPTTPLTTLRFAQIAARILPAGVFNVLCDENDLGGLMSSHPGVDKVAFTGSTATGRKVMASAADSIKRISLELGGNDAAIVLDDVDAKTAAGHVFGGAMVNAGQVCVAIKRAYVPASIYEDFCDEIAQLAQGAIVDDGEKQGTQIGPVQNRAQYDKLRALLEQSALDGKVIAGGTALDRPGYFIAPTIVRDIAEDSELVQGEQFGPILPVLSYVDLDDALARANATSFGLAATVWSNDLARAAQVAERVEAGTVWVNHHLGLQADIPFRGAKQSGFGGELGVEGLHEYTQPRILKLQPLVAA